ncbi:MAG: hypothetical protein HQK79_10800 [Desulfobacterales bacterium]|nr:hypothetical protein [Desulfobacterales bacterium]MBF0396495.1 hypothetical protein [Desulfobacterales bacterium]
MDHILKIYPKNSEYIPDQAQEESVKDLLNQLFDSADDIDCNLYQQPISVDENNEHNDSARYIVDIHMSESPKTISEEELAQISEAMGCECASLGSDKTNVPK